MTKVTAAEVNQLRKATGAGMMDCKNALVEANGDFDAAINVLRKNRVNFKSLWHFCLLTGNGWQSGTLEKL